MEPSEFNPGHDSEPRGMLGGNEALQDAAAAQAGEGEDGTGGVGDAGEPHRGLQEAQEVRVGEGGMDGEGGGLGQGGDTSLGLSGFEQAAMPATNKQRVATSDGGVSPRSSDGYEA